MADAFRLRVIEAATCEDAVDKARTLGPDVVTTNIGHTSTDGCQLCEELKKDKRTEAIPIVAVTAWAMGGNVERARLAGCDTVLVKPVLPEDLLLEIRCVLAESGVAATRTSAGGSRKRRSNRLRLGDNH